MATKKAAKRPDDKTKADKKDEKPKQTSSAQDPKTTEAASVALVDLEQMAQQLKLTPAQVRKMVRGGQIRGVKVDGEWQFNPKLVQQMLGRRAKGK
jgi:hypothetical protein